MSDSANTLGLDGFAFAGVTSPDPETMAGQLEQLDFTLAARSPDEDMALLHQGRVALVLKSRNNGQAADCRKPRGPSANGSGLTWSDFKKADVTR